MDKKIIKLNMGLKIIATIAFAIALFLCWIIYRSSQFLQKPVPGMRITFEMYQGQVALLNTVIYQLLPMIVIALFIIGISIFYYLKRRGQLEV
jgi:hypothetical protein